MHTEEVLYRDFSKELLNLILKLQESRMIYIICDLSKLVIDMLIRIRAARSLLSPLDKLYCLADDRLEEAVKFLDHGDGSGWQLLHAMLNPEFRKRPIVEAVLDHRFMTGATP
ncbi:uncharacterized protein LOC126671795 [Mercurialis annua]|uniref:uncharacterized protein LOC126671795 n=1 Tax=Mercurialis annua TaxID=3986 RepID=UPI00215F7908|nr:uncharacterized protein LOC126671795 [Mercurialis annua]